MELFKAANQWSSRPDDERFETLETLETACKYYQASAREKEVPYGALRVEAQAGDLHLVGRAGVPAQVTNWAFGQLAKRIGAPAGYLRALPATLAAQNLNHGLANLTPERADTNAQLLFHQNGSLVLRALTSDSYTRIWNGDVVAKLRAALPEGWRTPPARPAHVGQKGTRRATAADVISSKNLGGRARNQRGRPRGARGLVRERS